MKRIVCLGWTRAGSTTCAPLVDRFTNWLRSPSTTTTLFVIGKRRAERVPHPSSGSDAACSGTPGCDSSSGTFDSSLVSTRKSTACSFNRETSSAPREVRTTEASRARIFGGCARIMRSASRDSDSAYTTMVGSSPSRLRKASAKAALATMNADG